MSACSSRPPFAEVSGVVLLDGKPMPDAIVQFLPDPDKNTEGPTSSGKTDEEGRFHLMSEDKYGRDGAVVGFHRVVVWDARTVAPPRNRWSEGKRPICPLRGSRSATPERRRRRCGKK